MLTPDLTFLALRQTSEIAVAKLDYPDHHAALDRIAFPQEASRRIAGLLTPGSTVMISDNGISHETGRGTDFILLTR